MTRRDRHVRNALDKLVIAERYAREAREALMQPEAPESKPVRISEEDVREARRILRLEA